MMEQLQTLLRDEKWSEAIALLSQWCRNKPERHDYWYLLGNLRAQRGDFSLAENCFRQALALHNNWAEASNNLGNCLQAQGKTHEAEQSYLQALQLNPKHDKAYCNLGNVLHQQGRLSEAVKAYKQALAIQPDYVMVLSNLGNTYQDQNHTEEALSSYRQALKIKPDYRDAHSNLLLSLHYDTQQTGSQILQAHQQWDRVHGGPEHRQCHQYPNPREPERRLRIGYVSPDLCNHSVAYFFESLLANQNHEHIESTCYANLARPDHTTARLKQHSDHWREIIGLNPSQVGQQIRDDGIDILIDLAGHTAGNRLDIFVAKPAPIQLSWLGYPNTTGLSAMDGRLSDTWADPTGSEQDHSEALYRLPHGFLSYRPLDEAPEVAPPPKDITFGSFNTLAKHNDHVIALWSQLLQSISGSRLLLKNRSLADRQTRDDMRARFAAHGIKAERLQLLGQTATQAAHLDLYRQISVALDPFPYNGTTTSCEALWMGVPLITLAGERHAGRVGISLLHQLGRTEWIASSEADYLLRVKELVEDRTALAKIRGQLREQMRSSMLCDGPGLAREMEDLWRGLWRQWCKK